ncbi:MAG TPA: ABC transporter ATP-binding protein [Candidatus Acidoferrales bacterium]|nr:ABC transporter ATP-binding protein [Candidatus Acidoferrales bacterium]
MIELVSVGRTYGSASAPVTALHDVNLVIQRGEFVAIVGPSGSGKSTLLNLIGCLDKPSSGRLLFLGEDTSTLTDTRLSRIRNRSIGFVFQMFNLVPELTVYENIELPLVYAGITRQRRALTTKVLERVGMAHRAEHPASLLSGGEQQRVAIARALVNDPALILADEPTGSIDPASAEQVMELLSELHDQARTIVLVTHNMSVAAVAQRVVRIQSGTIMEIGRGSSEPETPAARTDVKAPAMQTAVE